MTFVGLDLGSWAEWIAANAAGIGTLLSIFALRRAGEANRTAERTRQEALAAAQAAESRESDRDRRAEEQRQRVEEAEAARDRRENQRASREAEREHRQLAGSVQSWWAKNDAGEWGLLVSNETGPGSVFHDVEISTVGNKFSRTVTIETLPPGRFWVTSGTAATPWGLPKPIDETARLDPLMRSQNHGVTAISFTDPLGKRWCWTPQDGFAS